MKKRIFLRILTFLGVLSLGAGSLLLVDRADAEKPSYVAVGAEVTQAVLETGFDNTIYSRVPNGESCVEASESRSRTIAAALRKLRDEGKMGDYSAVVGTKSGYWVGIGSLHTYSVIEFRDRDGNYVRTWTVDNYLGGTPGITRWWSADWNDPWTNKIDTVKPRRPKPPNPTQTIRNLPKPPRHPVGGPGTPHVHHRQH